MSANKRLRSLLAWCLVVGGAAHAQSTVSLQNSAVKYTFSYDTSAGRFWLGKSEPKPLAAGKEILFTEIPAWSLVLHVDPTDPCWAGHASIGGDRFPIEVDATSLGGTLSVMQITTSSNKSVHATWQGSLPIPSSSPILTLPCMSGFQSFVNLSITVKWTLPNADDHLKATIFVDITNKSRTPYRVATVRFPRVEVQNLSSPAEGEKDWLAVGRSGGLLYNNPINHENPYTQQHFTLSQDFGASDYPVGAGADVFGAGYAVPLMAYYETNAGGFRNCLYIADDDLDGAVKTLLLEADRSADTMRIEIVQVATGNAYTAQNYVSPYAVHLAGMLGDWVDAAKKYKEVYTSDSTRYLGPSASPANTRISQALKESPHYGILVPNRDFEALGALTSPEFQYCPEFFDVGDLENPTAGTPGSAAECLDAWEQLLPNLPFPMLAFDRFFFDPPTEAFASGYTPSSATNMVAVHKLVADAENNGHHVTLMAGSEKLLFNNCSNCAAGMYWCSVDPEVRQIAWESQLISSYDYLDSGACGPVDCAQNFANICPLAIADTSLGFSTMGCPDSTSPCSTTTNPGGLTWADWGKDLLIELLQNVGNDGSTVPATGGLVLTAPAPSLGGCFSKNHAHTPGIGSFFFEGWVEMIDDIRAVVGSDMPLLLEASSSLTSPIVTVQNPWSFDTAADPYNTLGNLGGGGPDFTTIDAYFDSPVYKIPMQQMVCDDIRYATQYHETRTCGLPYTNAFDPGSYDSCCSPPQSFPTDYFEDYPAVTAALGAWQQANRVLIHQSSVLFTNFQMYPPDALLAPQNKDDVAARGMLDFYAGLVFFLRAGDEATAATDDTLMGYFAGSMERNLDIAITNATETFTIPSSTIQGAFPKLADLLSEIGQGSLCCLPDYPVENLALDKYRPARRIVFVENQGLSGVGSHFLPQTPEEEVSTSWLPHGMYRHWTGDRFAFLFCNPWGVEDETDGGLMNPFTYAYGGTPVSNTYTYSFDLDMSKYDSLSSHEYAVVAYNKTGQKLNNNVIWTQFGTQATVTGTLAPFQYACCFVR